MRGECAQSKEIECNGMQVMMGNIIRKCKRERKVCVLLSRCLEICDKCIV